MTCAAPCEFYTHTPAYPPSNDLRCALQVMHTRLPPLTREARPVDNLHCALAVLHTHSDRPPAAGRMSCMARARFTPHNTPPLISSHFERRENRPGVLA